MAAGTNSNVANTPGSADAFGAVLNFGGQALNGYFQLEAAKAGAKTIQKAPVGSIAVVVGGAVLVVLVLVFALKK
jgi:hypothetical protein